MMRAISSRNGWIVTAQRLAFTYFRAENGPLTWLPFEVSSLKSTRGLCLEGFVGAGVQCRAVLAPRTLRRSSTLSVFLAIWGSWWCTERVAFYLDHACNRRSEICVFEYSCSLSTDLLLWPWCSLSCLCIHLCLFFGPFWGKSTLVRWKLVETLQVVSVPKVELEVLGGVFNVDEVVHEVACCAWLEGIVSAKQVTFVQA